MNTTTNHTRKAIAVLVLLAGAGGLGSGAAQAASPNTDAPPATEAPPSTAAPADGEPAPEVDCLASELPEGSIFAEEHSTAVVIDDQKMVESLDELDPEVRAELLDSMKADNDAFIAALDKAGVDYELIKDPVTGLELPAIDEDDETVQKALDEAFGSLSSESGGPDSGDSESGGA